MQPIFFSIKKATATALCLVAATALAQLFGQKTGAGQAPSQPRCGSEMAPDELAQHRASLKKWRAQKPAHGPTESTPPTVWAPVVFTIVRSSGGEGVTEEQASQALAWANEKFAPANVQFYECRPPEVVVSDTWFNTEFQFEWDNVCNAGTPEYEFDGDHHIDNVLNIYCANTNGWSWAPGPGSKDSKCWDWVIFHQGHIGSQWLLGHELGHYFGLAHTFSGFDENATRNPNNNCWNCEDAGDGFCDTPADRHNNTTYGWSAGCIPDPVDDDCGQAIVPDGLNLMSYSNSACDAASKIFSPEQRERIYAVATDERAYLHCPSDCYATLQLINEHLVSYTYRAEGLVRSTAQVGAPFCVNYQSETEVRLEPGFRAGAGSLFKALLATCVDGADNPEPPSADRSHAFRQTGFFEKEKGSATAAGAASLTVSPNPLAGEATVSFQLNGAAECALQTFDGQGRLAVELSPLRTFSEGAHSFRLDAGGLPPGPYFIVLTKNGMKTVQKAIVSRQ